MKKLPPLPSLSIANANVRSVGTDIVHVPRIDKILRNNSETRLQRILRKFMHPKELQRFRELQKTQPLKAQSLYVAGVWATKESLLKSLPSSQDKPPAIHIYTRLAYKYNDITGRPILKLDKNSFITSSTKDYWDQHLKSSQYIISLSHDQDYLVCFLVQLEIAH